MTNMNQAVNSCSQASLLRYSDIRPSKGLSVQNISSSVSNGHDKNEALLSAPKRIPS